VTHPAQRVAVKLTRRQVWIDTLLASTIPVEVCHVERDDEDEGTKKGKKAVTKGKGKAKAQTPGSPDKSSAKSVGSPVKKKTKKGKERADVESEDEPENRAPPIAVKREPADDDDDAQDDDADEVNQLLDLDVEPAPPPRRGKKRAAPEEPAAAVTMVSKKFRVSGR
jgi:hypothetical protein